MKSRILKKLATVCMILVLAGAAWAGECKKSCDQKKECDKDQQKQCDGEKKEDCKKECPKQG